MEKNTIRLTSNGNFQYCFSNGYMLSIGCGPMHYSTNMHEADAFDLSCEVVEGAIMTPAGGSVALEMDVAGYVPAANIPSLMRAVENKTGSMSRSCVVRMCTTTLRTVEIWIPPPPNHNRLGTLQKRTHTHDWCNSLWGYDRFGVCCSRHLRRLGRPKGVRREAP